MNDSGLSKERGQSIILVAVAMVALVLFVAITVDMSNAYYHRRTAQNGADGAALGGVRQLAKQKNGKKNDDQKIQIEMNDFAERNGIEDTGGATADALNLNVDGWYVDMDGNRLDGEPMVGDGSIPDGTYGVEAITYITAPTFFGGVFGLGGVPLQARAVSLLREACGADCVVPITTERDILCGGNPHECKEKIGRCFNIWRESQTDTPGAYGWINWTWQEAMCDPVTGDGRPCPNVDQGQNACDTGTLDANLDPRNCASGFIEVGDWVSNASGVMNSQDHVLCWLRYYLGSRDMDCNEVSPLAPHPFVIPVYDGTNEDVSTGECNNMNDPYDPSTGGLHYQVAGFARMQILGFRLSQGGSVTVSEGNDGFDYNGEACETIGEEPNNGFRITARFDEYVQDFDTSSSCFDPLGTLLSAPRLDE
jgi:hypothetical protein